MNIYLLCNSDIMNFVLKTSGGGEGIWESGGAEDLILLLFFFGVLWLLVGEMWWGWAESLT